MTPRGEHVRLRGELALRGLRAALVAVAVVGWSLLGQALPTRTGWVTDAGHALSGEQRQALEDELSAFEKRTGAEVAVVTVDSLEGKTIEDYSYELARAWQVGKRDLDNGVVLLVAPGERKMRIETGKGVGDRLTDLESRQILDEVLRPRLRQGDSAGALTEGARAIVRKLDPAAPAVPAASPRNEGSCLEGMLKLAAILFLVAVVIRGLVWLLEAVGDSSRDQSARVDAHRKWLPRAKRACTQHDKLKKWAAGMTDLPEEIRNRLEQSGQCAHEVRAAHKDLSRRSPRSEATSERRELAERPLRALEQQNEQLADLLEKHDLLHRPGVQAAREQLSSELQSLRELRDHHRSVLDDTLGKTLDTLDARASQVLQFEQLKGKDPLVEMRQLRYQIDSARQQLEQAQGAFLDQAKTTQQIVSRLGQSSLQERVDERQRAWDEARARFPHEQLGDSPRQVFQKLDSQGRQAAALATQRSREAMKGWAQSSQQLQATVDELSSTFSIERIVAQIKERRERTRETLQTARALEKECGQANLTGALQEELAKARRLLTRADEQLALGDQGNSALALDCAQQAEALLQKVKPTPEKDSSDGSWSSSSSSSHDSGSSGSSYDSGSSGSSYDSGSSGSSYDSGSSGSSYDSGGSSGGGDFGGGGSSSDW